MIKQLANYMTIDDVICFAGLILLGIWLLKTSWGRRALVDSVPRRNSMPLYLPFILLLTWFGAVALAISITRKLSADLPDWQKVFLDNLVLCTGAMVGMAIIIFLVRVSFARRLKGFGLDPKTIHKDFLAAFVNLFSVWPIVLLALVLTIYFGKLIFGPNFEVQQHQELESITEHSQLSLRVLIIVTAVVVVPAFEEMLFRGLFQTMFRSFTKRMWLSILLSSGLFATVHSNTGHWPALFVLAMCMGYSYEKSGSLFRPIFIHSLFNAASIIAALNQ